MLPVYVSDAFLAHDTGPDHVERPARIVAIRDLLKAQPFASSVRFTEPPEAPEKSILAVHEKAMIETTRNLCETGGGSIDSDTVVGRDSWRAALLSAGAVWNATKEAAELIEPRAFCLVRPPGHHATRERSMGFCLLNNVAVAAQAAIDGGAVRRVLVFDHDVHHGNGTQEIFSSNPDVLYMSVHQSPLYPGTGAIEEIGAGEGEGFTVNAP